jgi:hypothetical protein
MMGGAPPVRPRLWRGLVWSSTAHYEAQALEAFDRIFGPRGLTFDAFLEAPFEFVGKGTPLLPGPLVVGGPPTRGHVRTTVGDVVLRNLEGFVPVLAVGLVGSALVVRCWDDGGPESRTQAEGQCQDAADVVTSLGILCPRHYRLVVEDPGMEKDWGMTLGNHAARDTDGRWWPASTGEDRSGRPIPKPGRQMSASGLVEAAFRHRIISSLKPDYEPNVEP